jgi:hypothetical protein
MASASPRWMSRYESPTACAEVVQAVQVAELGPLAPERMEIQPEARLTIAAGMKKGEMREGPRSIRMVCSRSMVANPPMPLPMNTPTISSFPGPMRRPESARANSAAATANWMKRSIFLTSFFSTQRSGSKPFTSQAKRAECCEASKSVMGPAPERPALSADQLSSVPMPTGDTSPTPVTTTLRSAPTWPPVRRCAEEAISWPSPRACRCTPRLP